MKLFKWLGLGLAALLLVAAALALQTWIGKPLRFEWFVNRSLLQHALRDPELLTSLRLLEPLGIDGHNARLTDASDAHDQIEADAWKHDLDTLHRYDRDALSPQQQLAYDVMDWYVGMQVESDRWRLYNFPVNPLFGVQSELPTLMATQQSVTNAHEAQQYLQRLDAFDDKFQQVLDGLRRREERGIIPPQIAVQKVLVQMRAFVAAPVTDNILYSAFADKLRAAKGIDETQRTALLQQAADRIEHGVYPAYDQLIAYFERLQIKARSNDGAWSLPDGDAYYAFAVRQNTTTDLTPEELHQLGLAEVTRIEAEMDAILREQGYAEGTVGERMAALGAEPRFRYEASDAGRAACLADFKKIIDDARAGLGQAFAHLPKSPLDVQRVPAFKEQTSPQAYYDPAPLDGSRAGTFWVNLRTVDQVHKFGMRTLAYHEAVPGHHLQISVARELADVSTAQRILPFTAYVEGWALYAERLAKEMGYENDPFDDLGRLQAELFRAVRLVVDTGMHYKRWSREQAIDYMVAQTGMPQGDVVAEIERYLIWPGQALAYKTGMLKILELRSRAQNALGARFDIKDFHDQVLLAGALPLDVLEARIDRWIAAQQAAAH